MDLLKRHGDHGHGHEEKHGHGHQSEDGLRQHFLACLYWYVLATLLIIGSVSHLVSLFVAKQR
jgi:hypothetical protein